jgi:5-methylcytosine-specific restriction endonuclease McrA
MVWPFGRRKRKIERARREYRAASAEVRRATKQWSLFGARRRAIRRAAKDYERAQERLRKLGVIEETRVYPRNWASLRANALARDRRRCTRCGARGRRVELHVHHIVPLARGGRNALDNLTTLCRDCHQIAHRRR